MAEDKSEIPSGVSEAQTQAGFEAIHQGAAMPMTEPEKATVTGLAATMTQTPSGEKKSGIASMFEQLVARIQHKPTIPMKPGA